MHTKSFNSENERLAVSLANPLCGNFVCRQMTLRSAKHFPIRRERKPFLVINLDDAQKFFLRKTRPSRMTLGNQVIDQYPSLWIQLDPNGVRPVSKHKTQELAELLAA
jgi:hypothetical protein